MNQPTWNYKTPNRDYGDVMTIDEWNEMTECGGIIDDDGHGHWSKDGKMDVSTDVFTDDQRDATHVIWFNK